MILESVFSMRTRCISGHSQIMPDSPPLRHKAGYAPGYHSSPGLKARGFLGVPGMGID